MLLRSASTPLLGSLISSVLESPNNNIHLENNPTMKHPSTSMYQNHNKLSFNHTGPLNLSSSSCIFSPVSQSIVDTDRHKDFRRAQSEGNLQGLADVSYCINENPVFWYIDEEEEEESDSEDEKQRQLKDSHRQKNLSSSIVGDLKAMSMESEILNLGTGVNSISTNLAKMWDGRFIHGQQLFESMHPAMGLGLDECQIGGFGGGNGEERSLPGCGGDGGDRHHEVEEYYKRMVEENPGNSLFLRNYAQYLYQSRRDLTAADEYYSRAILADPEDGEVLSQYAKLVWELNQDEDRASSYHERAIRASHEDSHVHAAYAGFLWETEEDGGSCSVPSQDFHEAAVASSGS